MTVTPVSTPPLEQQFPQEESKTNERLSIEVPPVRARSTEIVFDPEDEKCCVRSNTE